MAPPCYGDLGKNARDLLNKGYNFGSWKLEAKSKTDSGLKFKTHGINNIDNGKVLAGIESEYSCKDYGLKFVEKWNTDNVLSTEVSIEDQGFEGLKVAFDSSFNPSTGKKRGVIKTSCKGEYAHVNADVDFDFAGPTIRGAAVFGYKGWLAGYQMAFDTAKSKLANNNFALGFDGGDYELNANVNDGQDFGGSIYHKLNSSIKLGTCLGWTAGTNATQLSLGAKYDMSDDTTVRAKVSSNSQIGMSLQQKLKDGITLTLSGLVDAKNFNQGGHRVGLALEFEQ